MFRKLTIALIATASLTAAAIAPASAKPMGGGFGGHHHFGHFGGFGVVGVLAADAVAESCFVTQRVMTPYGYRMRTVNVCD